MSIKLFEKGLIKQKKFKIAKINSPEFYRQHPDLAPRNIYLQEDRVITRKDMDKAIRRLDMIYKIEDFVHNIQCQISLFFKKITNRSK